MGGSALRLYFALAGLISASLGIALLIDFRGLGRVWEQGVNRNSAYINKLAHLPWPPNRELGPTYRKFAGILAVVIGAFMIVSALVGGMR